MPGPTPPRFHRRCPRSRNNLGIRFELLCIGDIFESYKKTLAKPSPDAKKTRPKKIFNHEPEARC